MDTKEPELAMSLPETQTESPLQGANLEELDLTEEEKQSLEGMSDEEAEDFIDKKLTAKSRKQLEQKAYVMEEINDFVSLKPEEAANVIRAIMTLEDE
jgi:flagellar biosynthesis/type III secretory pathway M-ring protein FliF/YscJ